MGSKEKLLQQCEALEAYYERLNRDFYSNFHFKQLDDYLPASPQNTVIVAKRGEKQRIEQLFIEVKAVLASALDAYMTYKNGWFPDNEFAARAKKMIDDLSAEYDKTKHFFDTYKLIEDIA